MKFKTKLFPASKQQLKETYNTENKPYGKLILRFIIVFRRDL